MPVPATTGQLRTKVDDMEIGDYIQAYCDVTTGWQFGESGGKTELPVSGVAVDSSNKTHQNYFFYFVKVGKGLLVADRNWYHTVSWDSLNTWKNIQGYLINTLNIISAMSSNVSPNGVASASSIQSSDFEAYKTFNGIQEDRFGWNTISGQSTGWLQYDFLSPKKIRAYNMKMRKNGTYYAAGEGPKNWTFEGSNDGVIWTILDERQNQQWVLAESKTYRVNNVQSFSKYRINVSANGGHSALHINELEMFDTAGVIRSLTGGVAYADLSGNKSLTDQNKGAWPTNNEWDTYIVNFPPSLIQSGKSLDDVFHISNSITLTQDTPASGVGSSTNRIARGNNVLATGLFIPYSNTVNTNGFRPVFEYIDK